MSQPIVDQLKLSMAATLRTAEAFPPEKFDYTPSVGCMAVGEMIDHIAANFDSVAEPIAQILDIVIASDKPEAPLEHLAWSNERFLGVLAQTPNDSWDREIKFPDGFVMTIANAALVMLEHDAHHRGQLITYSHLLGIHFPKRWPRS
jgi:hypothetical protein